MALHIEIMYLSCNIVLVLLIGVYHLEYVSGDNEIDHTNVEGFPENHKDTKSLENFQTNHKDLDKRNLKGKSKGRNYVTSFHRKFYPPTGYDHLYFISCYFFQ